MSDKNKDQQKLLSVLIELQSFFSTFSGNFDLHLFAGILKCLVIS